MCPHNKRWRGYMVCVTTYSLVGEYVLDMHHIFSQHSPSFWAIGGRMSSGLRALAMHLTKVSLGKALVRMSAMLRLVGTWWILMCPFCKWSCSHLILRSTCLVLEFPGLMLFVHIAIVERLSSNMLTPLLWRSHVFQYPHCVEDWSDTADKAVKFSLCCGESYRSFPVALPDNRSTVIENQVSLLTFPCKSIICKTCITRSINPVS